MDATLLNLILLTLFVGVCIWAFGSKRKARFEKDAEIPFEEE